MKNAALVTENKGTEAVVETALASIGENQSNVSSLSRLFGNKAGAAATAARQMLSKEENIRSSFSKWLASNFAGMSVNKSGVHPLAGPASNLLATYWREMTLEAAKVQTLNGLKMLQEKLSSAFAS